jgi:omega-6 fatty acid desaturase (delta-12 desaturase)
MMGISLEPTAAAPATHQTLTRTRDEHFNLPLSELPTAAVLRRFAQPSRARAGIQLVTTLVPFCLCWLATFGYMQRRSWVALAFVLPAAAFMCRVFVIFHDCTHRSFLPSARWNDLCGRVLGILCLTPLGYWRATHTRHHASVADLDCRGVGDVKTLTVAEYLALGRGKRFFYRLYRNPLILFLVGPAYVFLFRYRTPMSAPRTSTWLSTQLTNLVVLAAGILAYSTGNLGTLLFTHLPILWITTSVAVWLFYVEHQFETTYWVRGPNWRFREAAVRGSSHVDLPRVLRWFTANIGPHHLHHLNSRIPNYRLYECLEQFPALASVNRITLGEALRATRLALWDEEAGRLVGFENLKHRNRATDRSAPPVARLASA